MADDTLNDIDINDIARGRRITAVTASELQMTPRLSTRPPRTNRLLRLVRRVFGIDTRACPDRQA